jgi:hypothetical protein
MFTNAILPQMTGAVSFKRVLDSGLIGLPRQTIKSWTRGDHDRGKRTEEEGDQKPLEPSIVLALGVPTVQNREPGPES